MSEHDLQRTPVRIVRADLGPNERTGSLSADITIERGHSGVGIGGYNLDTSTGWAARYISQTLAVAGVRNWSDLVGSWVVARTATPWESISTGLEVIGIESMDGSVVFEAAAEAADFQRQIDAQREIRNLLAHSAARGVAQITDPTLLAEVGRTSLLRDLASQR